MASVQKIAQIKKATKKKILDSSREQDVLDKVISYVKNEEYEKDIEELFIQIMSMSKKFQQQHLEQK